MTISYSNDVATAHGFAFLRLLTRWDGSVYKLLWKDLLLFLTFYYLIQLLYMVGLDEDGKRVFEGLVEYSSRYEKFFPLSFVLGFYVSNVMNRWWSQYQAIPWPTSIAVYVSSTIHGYDEVGRAMRRTIMRYVCLSLTLVLRVLSPRVQKRFPLMSSMIEAGLIHDTELRILEDLERKFPNYSKNFLPIVWAASIVTRARQEGRVHDDFAVKTLIEELNKFRGACGVLMTYNSISIPLVYTQVVTIAVYSYFALALMDQQCAVKTSDSSESSKYFESSFLNLIPIFTILQFVFYMGWLKVAQTLMNPFGDDDDDFDVNSMIDKNLQMSYLIVDEMHQEHPEILKDQYWDGIPQYIPDRHGDKDINLRSSNVEERDIVDYKIVEPTGLFTRRGTQVVIPLEQMNEEDVEAGTSSNEPLPKRISNDSNLIPRPSVISGRYKNDAAAIEKQSILEKTMKKIQDEDK